MTPTGHVMILASAGSGKTHALTDRYVRLLAQGAKPERIVALTFTRKAAGEFFDEILRKLARAAAAPAAAAQLATAIGTPALGAEDFLRLLRSVTDAMHRLRLGTLDGFFAQIVRNFPLELGLAGEFEVLEEHAAQQERRRVLREIFSGRGGPNDTQREFIEAFKRATFGVEEKRLGAQLDAFIDAHQEVFLAAPDGDHWGNPDRIWPEGTVWLQPEPKRDTAVRLLEAALAPLPMGEKQRLRWADFLTEFGTWQPGATMGKALAYLLKNALAAWPELNELTIERKKLELGPVAGAALRQVLQVIVGGEFRRHLEITRGIHAVMCGYEAVYHERVRRAGRLDFADVQRLLLPTASGGRTLSCESNEDGRLLIDFRLDAEIDHWLLDEFQDTSAGQWAVLKNLIDEVMQDPSRERSFFYVGDVKQAIFAWREGDPRLFGEIYDGYEAALPGLIEKKHLDESWRSGPPVIAMVNRVFGASAALAGLFPGPASADWNREWREHKSARPELGGHAAWLQAEDETERFALVRRILQEVAPLERGLSCAVLVQKNETAARLAEYLRHEGGLPATAESDLHVCTDNPVGAVLLALVQAAAHPGDTLAWQHLLMTPLAPVLAAEQITQPDALVRTVLRQIHQHGFERALETWWRKLEPRLDAADAFSRLRARQFLAAAGEFDVTGRREAAEFVQFMERYTVRQVETAAVIRVMTIHKSKGLGFDLVLLPDFEGTKLEARRDGLAVQRAEDRTVQWVLDLPGKVFCEHDEVLSAHVQAAEAAACYESLSLLYVALTRAKRAMYVITKSPGESSSRNFIKLLGETLGRGQEQIKLGQLSLSAGFVSGDPDWYERLAPAAAAVAPAEKWSRLASGAIAGSARLPARRPTEETGGLIMAEQLFAAESTSAAVDFGRVVHTLLARVEWAGEPAGAMAGWAGEGEAGRQATACLQAESLQAVWRRRERSTVWRERSFELVDHGVWVTGVFDRVIVEHDQAGAAVRATVFDFKTDSATAGALQRHARQLNLYRVAVAKLARLPVTAVECEIVLTRTQQRLTVPFGL